MEQDGYYYGIVIPAVTHNETVKLVLRNLLDTIRWGSYHCPVVVAWDNCSPEVIKEFETEYTFIESLPYNGETNLNFCKNSNRGVKYVYEKYHVGVLLVNQDVCLPHRIAIEKIMNMGISSPKAYHIDGTSGAKFFKLNQMADPGCPCNKTIEVNKGTPVHKFAGFCMWMSKYALGTIGYLDENTFTSSFEDDDYCIRAVLQGLPVEQYEIPVHHELKNREIQISTTGAYDLQLLGASLHKFREKWNIPQKVPHNEFPSYILENYDGIPPLQFGI